MNDLIKIDNINGILVTTSNRVADELGVEHKHLLEKIDKYINKFNSALTMAQFDKNINKFRSAELSAQFYIQNTYKTKNGRTVRNYLITEKGIAQLIGSYSNAVEKAFYLNVAYINKFEELKNKLSFANENKKITIKHKYLLVENKKLIDEIEKLQYEKGNGSKLKSIYYIDWWDRYFYTNKKGFEKRLIRELIILSNKKGIEYDGVITPNTAKETLIFDLKVYNVLKNLLEIGCNIMGNYQKTRMV